MIIYAIVLFVDYVHNMSSRNSCQETFTFQEAANEAIAQEAARKAVKDIADSLGGETSASGDSSGANEVTCENRKSRFRFTKRGKGHGRDEKSGQSAGDKKRCFRCGLTNHTQDNYRHKGAECFKCHKTGHLQSECPNGKSPPNPKKDRQHVRLAEDSEELGPSNSEDGFHASIFTLESESRDSKISAPAVKVPVRIEDVDFQMEVDAGAAASIVSYTDYERYSKYLALRPVNKYSMLTPARRWISQGKSWLTWSTMTSKCPYLRSLFG